MTRLVSMRSSTAADQHNNVRDVGEEVEQVNEPEESNSNLQPSGLLSRQAMGGRFSMADILRGSGEQEQHIEDSVNGYNSEDPINLGLLTTAVAKSLFERFAGLITTVSSMAY